MDGLPLTPHTGSSCAGLVESLYWGTSLLGHLVVLEGSGSQSQRRGPGHTHRCEARGGASTHVGSSVPSGSWSGAGRVCPHHRAGRGRRHRDPDSPRSSHWQHLFEYQKPTLRPERTPDGQRKRPTKQQTLGGASLCRASRDLHRLTTVPDNRRGVSSSNPLGELLARLQRSPRN